VRGPAEAAPVGRGVGDSWEDTPVGMALVQTPLSGLDAEGHR
jgi:hypothetical protein